jgi:hypothetical protein
MKQHTGICMTTRVVWVVAVAALLQLPVPQPLEAEWWRDDQIFREAEAFVYVTGRSVHEHSYAAARASAVESAIANLARQPGAKYSVSLEIRKTEFQQTVAKHLLSDADVYLGGLTLFRERIEVEHGSRPVYNAWVQLRLPKDELERANRLWHEQIENQMAAFHAAITICRDAASGWFTRIGACFEAVALGEQNGYDVAEAMSRTENLIDELDIRPAHGPQTWRPPLRLPKGYDCPSARVEHRNQPAGRVPVAFVRAGASPELGTTDDSGAAASSGKPCATMVRLAGVIDVRAAGEVMSEARDRLFVSKANLTLEAVRRADGALLAAKSVTDMHGFSAHAEESVYLALDRAVGKVAPEFSTLLHAKVGQYEERVGELER